MADPSDEHRSTLGSGGFPLPVIDRDSGGIVFFVGRNDTVHELVSALLASGYAHARLELLRTEGPVIRPRRLIAWP